MGGVMQLLAHRKGELVRMVDQTGGPPRVPGPGARPHRLALGVPDRDARHRHAVLVFEPLGAFGEIKRRPTGSLVPDRPGRPPRSRSMNLQERGPLFGGPGRRRLRRSDLGENARDNDLDVNHQGQAAHEHPRRRRRRVDHPRAAPRVLPRPGARVHRRRRARRGDAGPTFACARSPCRRPTASGSRARAAKSATAD